MEMLHLCTQRIANPQGGTVYLEHLKQSGIQVVCKQRENSLLTVVHGQAETEGLDQDALANDWPNL